LAFAGVLILHLLFTYAPLLQAMFGNEAIPLWVWPWLLPSSLLFFVVVEAEKLVIRLASSPPSGSWQRADALREIVTAVESRNVMLPSCRRATRLWVVGHVWTAPLRQVLSWRGDDCGRVRSCVWPV
jgi:hypothetical protein